MHESTSALRRAGYMRLRMRTFHDLWGKFPKIRRYGGNLAQVNLICERREKYRGRRKQ
jgi:hypothetical protein